MATPTSTPTRKRATTRVAYTGYATRGGDDDHIIDHNLKTFYKTMAWLGGAAILAWLVFGGYSCGKSKVDQAPPTAIEQSVRPTPAPFGELTPEELDRRHSEYLRKHGG